MALYTIQPNFKIPYDYERLFMLFGEKDFSYIVIADRDGLHTGQRGAASKKEESWCRHFQNHLTTAKTITYDLYLQRLPLLVLGLELSNQPNHGSTQRRFQRR